MSRYEIPGREPHLRLVVGWDRPLRTYFAQVWDERLPEVELEEDAIRLWVGCFAGEITSPEALAEAVKEYADFGPETLERLRNDRAAVE